MAKETGSSRVTDKGPVTRSSTETMYKKVVLTPPTTRNRGDKGTPPPPLPPPPVVAATVTPNHLRRSERTRNLSPSTSNSQNSSSKRLKSVNQLGSQERDAAAETSSYKLKRKDARAYRAGFRRRPSRDCHEESNRGDNFTQEGGNGGGVREEKMDECFKGDSLDSKEKEVSEDGIRPPEDAKTEDQSAKSGSSEPVKELSENNLTQGSSSVPSDGAARETSGASERVRSDCHREEEASQTLASRSSMLNENLIGKCANGEDQSAKSGSSGPVQELSENNVTRGSSVPSDAANHETSGASERVQSDCRREEASQTLASRSSMLNENLIQKCANGENQSAMSGSSGPVQELSENNVTQGLSVPSDATARETSGSSERVQSDCHREEEASQTLASRSSMLNENLIQKCANGEDQSAKSGSSGPVRELSENNVTQGLLVPSDAASHETSGASERVQSDCHREEEASQTSASRSSMLNENLNRKCANGEILIPCKRKRNMGDKDSDISATLADDENCNLIVDASPSRLCSNIIETSESCSKRIRRISLSDVQRDQKKSMNNVDQPCSKSYGERLSTRNEEGNSGDSGETPLVSGVETEKIRKAQKSLHLKLKPKIATLCEILLLPGNVKSMVEKCLEYTMNNHRICMESVSIAQAFQLSLCWTASSLLNHKLDFEASLELAKQHLNFDCDKDVVDKIYSMMCKLKKNFLSLTGNSKVTGSPKASESPSRNYSNTEETVVEFAKRDISKNIKEIEIKNQWEKLLSMLEKEKQKLKNDIENEKADFQRRCKIEWTTIKSFSPNGVIRNEKLKVYHSGYGKRLEELQRQHDIRRKDLEAKQSEAKRKFQESWSPDEWSKVIALKELGAPKNAPKALVSDHVAEGKNSENIVQTISLTENGVRLSEPFHNIAENEYEGQGNISSKHSNSREQSSDGATSREEDERCEILNRESHNGCRQDSVLLIPLSSNGEICDVETSDVPGREMALAVHQTSSSNDAQVDISSSKQATPDGTILSKTVCSLSVKSYGFSDGVKDMASLNSQSPEKDIPSVNTMCIPNCKNAAQIHEPNDGHGSSNADTLNSPLSDERISSWNSKSPQHVDSVNVTCGPNSENSALVHKADDNNGSNNVVTLNSLLIDERSTHDVLDKEVQVGIPGTVNFTPTSTEQVRVGAVNDSVLDRVLPTPCGTAGPSNSPDANAIILSNQPFSEKQNPEKVSSSISTGQNPVEVSETSHDQTTVSELDKEAAVGMLGTVSCTDCPNSTAPLNSSSTDQVSDEGALLTENATLNSSSTNQPSEGVLSSMPCISSPSIGHPAAISLLNPPSQQQVPDTVLSTIPDGIIPVIMPECGHEEAECQLTDSAVAEKSTPSDQQEGVHRTMIEDTLTQATPVSRSVDLIEPREERQPLSSLESPHNQDTAKATQNSQVSNAVDILPGNQSNQTSLVMELPEQVQQLPSAGFLSSNQDLSNLPLVTGIEDQATGEDALSSHIPEASVEVQNQAVEQPASNLEIDSHSRQVVHPAFNLDTDSLMPGGVTTQSSDPRNLSTQGDINTHPIPTAIQSASRVFQPLCHDPLYSELDRIRKLIEQTRKVSEDMKKQYDCEYKKELVELQRKYAVRFMEIDNEFQKTQKVLDTQLNTVYVHRLLAQSFKATSMDHKDWGASGMRQDASFGQQLPQLSRQQHASLPYMGAPPSSCGPSAAIFPSSHATPGSQTMLSPTPAAYNTTGVFSGLSARPPPLINSISSPSGSLQAVGQIRAPAPHLQPFRASSSVPGPAPPHLQPFRPSTSVPTPAAPHLQPSRPSTPVPTPAPPHLQPFRPSTPVPPPAAPHLQPFRPSTPVPPPAAPHLQPFRPSTSASTPAAPHLQPSRPSTSVPTTVPDMMPNHPAPGNIPLPAPSFSNWLPRPTTIIESSHHRGHWPESTGGLPARNLPAMDLRPAYNILSGNNLPNVLPRLSDSASLELSKFVTSSNTRASSTHQTTSPDVVCLSDDD